MCEADLYEQAALIYKVHCADFFMAFALYFHNFLFYFLHILYVRWRCRPQDGAAFSVS